MTNPSNKVHDNFRRRSIGDGATMPTNSKSYCDNFHVDRSRLGVHEEYDSETKNDWGGKGRFVEVPNDIRRNAVSAMGDLRAKSSNRNPDQEAQTTGSGPCCAPSLYPPNATNPMYRKRKED